VRTPQPGPPARSRRGAGQLRRRSDGRWEARIWVRGRGGIWERRSYYGRTRDDVDRQLHAALVERADGTVPAATGKLTVGAFVATWLANKEVKVRPRTWISYRQLCRDHIVPVLGGIRLNKLGPDDVERLYASMLKKGSSPKTVRNAGGVLHSVLETAVKYRYLRANVAAVVELPRHSRPTINTLDERQVRTLVEAADAAGDPHATLWALALGTGARQGELLGLLWPDLDDRRGLLHIERSLIYVAGEGDHTAETKTKSSNRTIHIAPALVDRLLAYRAASAQSALREGRSYNLTGPIFQRPDGRPLSQNIVVKKWHAALFRAGLPAVRFHDARHSVATILLQRGMSARAVADQLGHSNITTTLNVYAHSTPTQHEQAAAILGEFLS
jgi:integrase